MVVHEPEMNVDVGIGARNVAANPIIEYNAPGIDRIIFRMSLLV